MSDVAMAPKAAKDESRFVWFWRQYLKSPGAVIALVVLLSILFVAAAAPLISPQNPYDLTQVDIMDNLQPPGSKSFGGVTFLLGTDGQGRDILSAIFFGLRTSLLVGVLSGVLALVLGVMVGLVAAYKGGWVDTVIMRIVDLQLSMPSILVALILLVLLGGGVDRSSPRAGCPAGCAGWRSSRTRANTWTRHAA